VGEDGRIDRATLRGSSSTRRRIDISFLLYNTHTHARRRRRRRRRRLWQHEHSLDRGVPTFLFAADSHSLSCSLCVSHSLALLACLGCNNRTWLVPSDKTYVLYFLFFSQHKTHKLTNTPSPLQGDCMEGREMQRKKRTGLSGTRTNNFRRKLKRVNLITRKNCRFKHN